MFLCAYRGVFIHMYEHVCVYAYGCPNVNVCIYVVILSESMWLCINVKMSVYICISVHVCEYTCEYVLV